MKYLPDFMSGGEQILKIPMKTQSAKAKGRRLQNKVAELIRQYTGLDENEVKSTPMGTNGVDIWLSNAALKLFPFAIECKNTESLNIWKAIEQAENNGKKYQPIVIFSRNRSDIYVTLSLAKFLEIFFGGSKGE